MNFDRNDLERMNQIDAELIEFLRKFNGVEAAIIAGAVMRRLRALYAGYPAETRTLLLEGAIAFLEGRDVDYEQRAQDAGIITPRGRVN